MAKEIEEKRARREEQAQFWPVAGTVHSCVILDQHGSEVYSGSSGFGTREGEVSYNALHVIASLLAEDGQLVRAMTLNDFGIRLFGLRIRDRMRIMALDALRFISSAPAGATPLTMIPVGLWNHHAFENGPWCDPYELVIPSELRNDVPWDSLAEFLNIDVPKGGGLDVEPRFQADMARQLALKAGLITA